MPIIIEASSNPLVFVSLNMAIKQNPPFRAEHIGSLLRPDYLLEARKKFDKKEITQEQLRELEDRAIIDALHMQREAGIKSFTDGEYRSVSRLHSRTPH